MPAGLHTSVATSVLETLQKDGLGVDHHQVMAPVAVASDDLEIDRQKVEQRLLNLLHHKEREIQILRQELADVKLELRDAKIQLGQQGREEQGFGGGDDQDTTMDDAQLSTTMHSISTFSAPSVGPSLGPSLGPSVGSFTASRGSSGFSGMDYLWKTPVVEADDDDLSVSAVNSQATPFQPHSFPHADEDNNVHNKISSLYHHPIAQEVSNSNPQISSLYHEPIEQEDNNVNPMTFRSSDDAAAVAVSPPPRDPAWNATAQVCHVSEANEETLKSVVDQAVQDPYGDKGIYTGTVSPKSGWPHGKGRLVYEGKGNQQRIFDGEWYHGRWHGYGKAKFSNGDAYEGGYEYDQRHGFGKYTWSDGRSYEGEFKEDKRHGKGTFRWPDGAVYEGDFIDGQRDGHGLYKFGGGCKYEGGWSDGKYSGSGTCIWVDGRCYSGQWLNGMRHGQGIETGADGKVRHDGQWAQDKPVGATASHSDSGSTKSAKTSTSRSRSKNSRKGRWFQKAKPTETDTE
ncbi:whole genome shotgun sequence [Seminavis robusta]|uniref:Whole genome shotgun sequence n=1 Tax=Seminavis robusta TaxID=568900 RepID=A0A9N8D8J3_9STRA|nr:whole genome shotgun sequence [Seminavis robusta]|eukprot:Sro35_g022550.1 whole genome shotgun sequence (513) ;mRNA; f:124987-126627